MWAGRGRGGIRSSDTRTLLACACCFFSDEYCRRQRGHDERAERGVATVGDGPIVVMMLGRRRGRGSGRLRRLAGPFAGHGEDDALAVCNSRSAVMLFYALSVFCLAWAFVGEPEGRTG